MVSLAASSCKHLYLNYIQGLTWGGGGRDSGNFPLKLINASPKTYQSKSIFSEKFFTLRNMKSPNFSSKMKILAHALPKNVG
jgi:hypothetical protein